MAAAECGCDLTYFTFGVKGLGAGLQELHQVLQKKKVTVGSLYKVLQEVAQDIEQKMDKSQESQSQQSQEQSQDQSQAIETPQLFNILIDTFD